MRPVGVLGGMGPEATILFMRRCMAAVAAADDADHVPLIVHQNPQVPSRIAALIDGTGDDPGPVLARMARDLKAAGATALVMPCNTAHRYTGAVRAAADLPFLDMVDLAVQALAGHGARRVGILASPAVRLTDVFGPGLTEQGITPVFPDPDDGVLTIIRGVKAGAPLGRMGAGFAQLAKDLNDEGCDHLLVACTELSLLTADLPPEVACTDSLDCLVNATVDWARRDGG